MWSDSVWSVGSLHRAYQQSTVTVWRASSSKALGRSWLTGPRAQLSHLNSGEYQSNLIMLTHTSFILINGQGQLFVVHMEPIGPLIDLGHPPSIVDLLGVHAQNTLTGSLGNGPDSTYVMSWWLCYQINKTYGPWIVQIWGLLNDGPDCWQAHPCTLSNSDESYDTSCSYLYIYVCLICGFFFPWVFLGCGWLHGTWDCSFASPLGRLVSREGLMAIFNMFLC